jgi:hypothetical protein
MFLENLFSFTNLHMFRVFRYKMRRIIFRYGNVRSLLRFSSCYFTRLVLGETCTFNNF